MKRLDRDIETRILAAMYEMRDRKPFLTEIAAKCGLHPTKAKRYLDNMAERGYLSEDYLGRMWFFSLTELGEAEAYKVIHPGEFVAWYKAQETEERRVGPSPEGVRSRAMDVLRHLTGEIVLTRHPSGTVRARTQQALFKSVMEPQRFVSRREVLERALQALEPKSPPRTIVYSDGDLTVESMAHVVSTVVQEYVRRSYSITIVHYQSASKEDAFPPSAIEQVIPSNPKISFVRETVQVTAVAVTFVIEGISKKLGIFLAYDPAAKAEVSSKP